MKISISEIKANAVARKMKWNLRDGIWIWRIASHGPAARNAERRAARNARAHLMAPTSERAHRSPSQSDYNQVPKQKMTEHDIVLFASVVLIESEAIAPLIRMRSTIRRAASDESRARFDQQPSRRSSLSISIHFAAGRDTRGDNIYAPVWPDFQLISCRASRGLVNEPNPDRIVIAETGNHSNRLI